MLQKSSRGTVTVTAPSLAVTGSDSSCVTGSADSSHARAIFSPGAVLQRNGEVVLRRGHFVGRIRVDSLIGGRG